ncbi:hypothetical protein [Vibrio barjaei]|uniref:hypothetical protein n=1 Tax=Vibrio barjaei TaxID=1676683 RepID=UPI00228343E5|nr:hypothetical protein [Vibrio barjaei]MCY9873857.1 hypothetical protein [Vibrio barjaei]
MSRRLTRSKVRFQNQTNNLKIEQLERRLQKLRADSESERRTDSKLCLLCYYLPMEEDLQFKQTVKPCGICDAQMTSNFAITDVICSKCSSFEGICKNCGADYELKEKKDCYPFELLS